MKSQFLSLLRRSGIESTIARNSIYLLMAEGAARVISLFVGKIILLRYLKPEGAGTMNLVMNYGIIAAVLAEWGMTQASVRHIARAPREELGSTLAHLMVLRGIMSLIMLVLVWGSLLSPLGNYFDPQVRILIVIWSISLVFQAFRRNSEIVFQSLEKLKYQALFLVINRLLAATLIIISVLMGWWLVGIFLSFLIADVADCLLAAWCVRKKVQRPEYNIERAKLWALLIMSLPFGLHLVATQLQVYADSVLIYFLNDGEPLATKQQIGWYTSAYALVLTLQFIPISVGNALFPQLARSFKTDRLRMRSLFSYSYSLFLLAGPLVAIPLYSLRYEFLTILFGQRYAPAAPMLEIVIWALPLSFAVMPVGNALAAMDRQMIVTCASFVCAAVNISLNFYLIPKFGGKGAAIATTATVFVGVIIQLIPLIYLFPRILAWKQTIGLILFQAAAIAMFYAIDESGVALKILALLIYGTTGAGIALFLKQRRSRLHIQS